MNFSYTEMMRVLKFKRMPVVLLVMLMVIFFILFIHTLGVIYYYSDYLVILLPEPPLPVMRRSRDNAKPIDHYPSSDTTNERKLDNTKLPRILCLIVTSPNYHEQRASHVAVTWATHCTKSVFLTTKRDIRLHHTVLTPGAETYEQLWGKVKQGFEWAYEHRDEFDWFFKADDDTFAVIENLQGAVSSLDPDHPQVTGNHLRTWDRGSTYLNGGAGYVLSRGAVTKLVEEGFKTGSCEHNLNLGTNEDVNMADCLTYLGVEFLDSRDSLKRQRFNVYPPQELIDPRQANRITHLWLKKVSAFPYKFGYSEMSDEVITFHYVDAQTMYLLYYLIYFVNPANSDLNQSFRKIHKSPINDAGVDLGNQFA